MRLTRHVKLPLLVLLVLTCFAMVQAREEMTILIDGNRNAAVQVHVEDSGEDVTGTLKASSDFAQGLAAVKGDLKLPAEVTSDIQGKGALFTHFAKNTMEVVGSLDLTLPADEPNMPTKLEGDLQSVSDKNKSFAKADFQIEVPTPDAGEVPEIALSGALSGSAKQMEGNLDYKFVAPAGKAEPVPLKALELSLADSGPTTTLIVTATMAKDDPNSAQLKNLSTMSGMVKSQLEQLGLTVEKVEASEPKETDTDITAGMTIAVKDLRPFLKNSIQQMGPMMAGDPSVDPQKMVAALNKMVEIKFDEFVFKLNVENNGQSFAGSVKGKVSSLELFLAGYVDLLDMIAASAQAQSAGGEFPDRLAAAFNEVQMEQAKASITALAESNASFKSDGKFDLKYAEGKVAASGNMNVTMDNVSSYVAKAKEKGLPVAENALVLGKLNLSGDRKLEGQFYMSSDIDFVAVYKQMTLDTLARMDDPQAKQAADLVKPVELKDSKMMMSFDGSALKIDGYSETSDLTAVLNALVQAGAPGFEGTLTGFSANFDFQQAAVKGDLAAHFKGFIPGKSANDVSQLARSMLGQEVQVTENASADQVKLVAVEKPDVQMTAELAAVQKEAQQLLASAEPPAGGGAGGGGGKTWMMVLGGVLLLGLIGAGLMASRKSA